MGRRDGQAAPFPRLDLRLDVLGHNEWQLRHQRPAGWGQTQVPGERAQDLQAQYASHGLCTWLLLHIQASVKMHLQDVN